MNNPKDSKSQTLINLDTSQDLGHVRKPNVSFNCTNIVKFATIDIRGEYPTMYYDVFHEIWGEGVKH